MIENKLMFILGTEPLHTKPAWKITL